VESDVGPLTVLSLGADTFEVTFGAAAYLWLLALVVIAIAGGVTMAKGRWGWLVLGLVTCGLLWLISAFLPPRTGSLWDRKLARRSSTVAGR
jgi:hypothetical protein